jgi:ABC-type Mn2+/Zn2+ transport system permease subunit
VSRRVGDVEALLVPFLDYGFMRLGLVAALAVGAACGVLSGVLVVRGQSLLGDAIGHAVLPGVVVGHLVAGSLGVPLGALVASLVLVAATTALTRTTPLHPETVLGIVFAPMFALGLALVSALRPRGIDIVHILFGNVLGVSPVDALLSAVGALIVIAVVFRMMPALAVWAFDVVSAESMGLDIRRLEQVFFLLLAITVVVALQTVGLVLVVAMLILPGAAGRMLSGSFPMMIAVSGALGMGAGLMGLIASFHLDVASGPAIVLAAGALCYSAMVVVPVRRARARARAA